MTTEHKVSRKNIALIFYPLFLLVCASCLVGVQENGFFWDNILTGSKIPSWYFDTGFRHLFMPSEIDAGHPPLFSLYIAGAWRLLGKNLLVSHWAMLPFMFGIGVQLWLLINHFVHRPKAQVIGFLLLMAEPTLLAQWVQVSPDVCLVFFYLLALNSIIRPHRLWLALALIGISLVSTRGIVAVVAIYLTNLFLNFRFNQPKPFVHFIQLSLAYIPCTVIVSGWLWMHYLETGWLGYNSQSSWAENYEKVDAQGFVRNLAVIAWRLIDFGRIMVWFVAGVMAVWAVKYKLTIKVESYKLLLVAFIPLFVFSCFFVGYTNPIGHRYYTVFYVLFLLAVLYQTTQITNHLWRNALLGMIALGAVGGHFIVYPDSIAKGWDSTLAHLPYYNLRKQMIAYIDQNHIPLQAIGSDFPLTDPIGVIDLNSDKRSFAQKDLAKQNYILQSNINNGFTDSELLTLKQHWELVKELKGGQVYMRLYKKEHTNKGTSVQ